MKVSVAFGEKRVVVPCRDGSLTVKQLIDEATRRYKKAHSIKMEASAGSLHSVDAFNSSLSPPPELTVVYILESRDGAIFDMDDRVCDVADDKETLIAVYHEIIDPLSQLGSASGGNDGGGGGGGDCASSGDGGNSSEHFTTPHEHMEREDSGTGHYYSEAQPHVYSEVFRAKSEEILNRNSAVPFLDDIENQLGANRNYNSRNNYNYSHNNTSNPSKSPHLSRREKTSVAPSRNMGSSSPDLSITENEDNTQTTNVEMNEKDEKLERLSESHSEDNFDDSRDSRHSSQLGTRGIKNSRSHTDGDLKLLSNTTTNDTYQYQKTKEKEAEDNRSKKAALAQPQRFRRGTFGIDASPRQTANTNSEMIDRWMTKHIIRDQLEQKAPSTPHSPPFVSSQLNSSYYAEENKIHENIASNNQFNHNSTMESYKSNHSSFQNNSTGTNFNSSRNVTSENGRNARMNYENNGSMERTVLEDLEERLKVDNNESGGEVSILTREQKNKQKMFTAPATAINTGGVANLSSQGSGSNIGQRVIRIDNHDENTPLGIQVVAQYEKKRQPVLNKNGEVVSSQRELREQSVGVGLMVRQVNEGGRAHSQKLLRPQDVITEINGRSLYGLTFDQSQSVFKSALQAPSLTLRIVTNHTVGMSGDVIGGNGGDLSSASISITPASSTATDPPVTGDGTRLQPPAQNRFFFPSPDRNQQNNNNNNSQNQTTTSATLNNNQLTSSTLPRAAQTRRQMQIEAQQATPIGHSTPPPVDQQQQNRTFHFDSPLSLMSRANTKKIGRKIKVQLTKGADGLGFSLTARDNSGPSNANSPVYVKKILPKGAAIQDGRLVEGDRMLEVNGTVLTGMSQSEVVSFLRSIPQGHTAHILVSRQEIEDMPRQMDCNSESSFILTRAFHALLDSLPNWESSESNSSCCEDKSESESHRDSNLLPQHHFTDSAVTDDPTISRTRLSFIIALNDTGSAGLGISVKGRAQKDLTSGVSSDTGVFVKNVINGGAAWKDGRLKVHDQLLSVNGQSLECMDNREAIDVLKNALLQHGKSGQASLRITVMRLESTSDEMDRPNSLWAENNQQDPNLSLSDHTNTPRTGDEAEVMNEVTGRGGGGFSRDSAHRRSLSEKRTGGGGKTRDANELAFYRERIKPLKDAAYKASTKNHPAPGQLSKMKSASLESIGGLVQQNHYQHDNYYRNPTKLNTMGNGSSVVSTGNPRLQQHNQHQQEPQNMQQQYYANANEVHNSNSQQQQQQQLMRRPSSGSSDYYNGMMVSNIPPPVPMRRLNPPAGSIGSGGELTVTGVQGQTQQQMGFVGALNRTAGDGADILNTDLARTFGDPTMTSKEQNKMKNSKSATGIFRNLFSSSPPPYKEHRSVSRDEVLALTMSPQVSHGQGHNRDHDRGHRYRSPNRPSRPPPVAAPRNHKKQDKDKSSLLSSAANANGNRSTSAPLRPQSAMPPITAPHRFSTQSNTSSTSQNSQQVGMTQSYGVNGAAGVQYQNNNGQLQQPRHQFYAHHNLSSAVASHGDASQHLNTNSLNRSPKQYQQQPPRHQNIQQVNLRMPSTSPSDEQKRHSSHEFEEHYGNFMNMRANNQRNVFTTATGNHANNDRKQFPNSSEISKQRLSLHSEQMSFSRSASTHERDDSNVSFNFDPNAQFRTSSPQQQNGVQTSSVGVSFSRDNALYAGSYATLPSHPRIDYKGSPIKKAQITRSTNRKPLHIIRRSGSPVTYGTKDDVINYETDHRRINVVNLKHQQQNTSMLSNEERISNASSELNSESPSKEDPYGGNFNTAVDMRYPNQGWKNSQANLPESNSRPNNVNNVWNRNISRQNGICDNSTRHNSNFDSDVDSSKNGIFYGTQSSPDPKNARRSNNSIEGNYQAFVGSINLQMHSGKSNDVVI
ncbi:uncharacterized protein LOC134855625 isoform X5 [Symsagittifera roscoffensis]|uniref:uncharacterized protein LOC134855625 isoform X5 n=1 Tax=Symsagittifera roscoffensis TaxID=84072 RepID=UPI00307B8D9C